MSAIIIKTDNKSSRILSQLAIQLGGNVMSVDDAQLEDFLLGKMMDKVKTGKTVSRKTVLKKLKSK
jgi:hypothetical protein